MDKLVDELFGPINNKVESRQEYNMRLVREVFDKVIEHPELRFIQILWNLKIVDNEDRFYEESVDTYKRLSSVLEARESLEKS